MRRLVFIAGLSTLLALSACAGNKVEQLDQESKSLKNDLTDLRTLQAQHSSAINEIRTQLRELSGKIEEIQHTSVGKTEELEQTISQLKSRVPPPAGVPEELLNQDEERIASLSGAAADDYKKSLSLIRTGDFEGAKQAFTGFIERNPGTAFTDNGLFWLGIAYDKLGQYDRAVGSFSEVFQKYPAEDMVAPALFFLSEALVKMGSKSDAVLTLQKLVDEHTSSQYGVRGKARLQELQGGSGGGRKQRR
jgi:TolA-binding protein